MTWKLKVAMGFGLVIGWMAASAQEQAWCDSLIISGCTLTLAQNYNPVATFDDGSCQLPGCMDTLAWNFNPYANVPDASCFGVDTGCAGDLNADGLIGASDLLEMLQLFGALCLEPTPEVCAPVEWGGYLYDVFQLGEQCWFAENLRTESYANGDPLPFGLTGFQWTAADQNGSGAGAVYGEQDASCTESAPDFYACDEALALEAYGRLYNGHAVADARGICPVGWHVPSDDEWTTLETVVGLVFGADSVGAVLKATSGWEEDGNGTDEVGFGGLPGGNRNNGFGDFNNAGVNGYWWSSTEEGGAVWYRSLSAGITTIGRYQSLPRLGFSVRCLRDAE